MSKMHSRRKRALGISTHRHGQMPAPPQFRQKTFKSEGAAKEWAKAHGVTIKELVPAKKGKRLRIVA